VCRVSPNLEQAFDRGMIMLVFEGRWRGGRCPLNALPKGRTFAFSAQDSAVLDWVHERSGGSAPAMLQLDPKDLALLLPLLADHPRLTLGRDRPLTVNRTPLRLALRATLDRSSEIELALREKPAGLRLLAGWAWTGQALQPLDPGLRRGLLQAPVRVPRWQVPLFLSQHWPQWQAAGGVEAGFRLETLSWNRRRRGSTSNSAAGSQLGALLQCAYGSRLMTVGVTPVEDSVWLPDPEDASDTRRATSLGNRRRSRVCITGYGPGYPGEAATAWAERGAHLPCARIPAAPARVDRDAGGTARA
jgi:hypothetical protein